jgi:hypothetical protein
MRHGFPGLGLLRGLRPTRQPSVGNEPALRHGLAAPDGRATAGGSHVHAASIDQVGGQLSPDSIATPTPQPFSVASPPTDSLGFGVDRRSPPAGHALHPGPYPPALSRHSSYGASTTGSLVVPPSGLACRTRPVWQSQTVPALSGLLPPSPAFPGSGCPQLRHAAATAPRRRSLTSTRCHAEISSKPVVRHEVPFDRVEVQGLHRWPVAAGW